MTYSTRTLALILLLSSTPWGCNDDASQTNPSTMMDAPLPGEDSAQDLQDLAMMQPLDMNGTMPPIDQGAPVISECNDGIDNDGDGLTDWQFDVGCHGPGDRSESAGTRADENGFTTFDLSDDSSVYYVSAQGDDANDGRSPDTSLKTLARAAELVEDGSHDFILMHRGDTFRDDPLLGRFKSGRARTEPLVIASYGESTQRPRLEISGPLIDHNGRARSFVALLGLELVPFKNIPGDPKFTGDSSNVLRYVGGGEGLLVEDCHLHYGDLVVQSFGESSYQDVEVRRNVIERTYHINTCLDGDLNGNVDFRPSGIFGSGIDGFLIEENIFDHNGWNLDEVPSACATIYNHNVYLPKLKNSVIRGNVFSRASSIHIKTTATEVADYDKLLIEDNFFVGGEIGVSIGGNNPGPRRFKDIQIQDNVMNQVGRGRPTTRGLAWGIGLQDHDTSTIARNLLLNFDEGNSWGIQLTEDTNQDVTLEDNLLYAINGPAMNHTNQSGHQRIVIRANELINPDYDACLVRQRNGVEGYGYSQNTYFSASGQDWFCSPDRTDRAGWIGASMEQDAITLDAAPGYPDPDRTIDSYAVVLGLGSTFEDYLSAALAQSRLTWRNELNAPAINGYMRAGFGR